MRASGVIGGMTDGFRFHVPPRRFSSAPARKSRGYLPHDQRPGLRQFVTFRLAPGYLARAGPLTSVPHAMDAVTTAVLSVHPGRALLSTWVVMPDHVHLVLRTGAEPLGAVVGAVKLRAAMRLRGLSGPCGPVFVRESFDVLLRDDEAATPAVAYVEANPVRKGLCPHALAWRWSGIHARLGRGSPFNLP